MSLNLVAILKMKITGFGMVPKVNTFTVVSNDVLGSWILIMPSGH